MSSVYFRSLPSGLTRSFMWLAWLTTALALGVHLSSYGPDEIGPSLMNVALARFPVVFLIFGPVVVVVGLARIPQDRLFTGLHAYGYVIGRLFLFFFFSDSFF